MVETERLPAVHPLRYPRRPEECRSAHGLSGRFGPMHVNQSGRVCCAACGTIVYGMGNPPAVSGVTEAQLHVLPEQGDLGC